MRSKNDILRMVGAGLAGVSAASFFAGVDPAGYVCLAGSLGMFEAALATAQPAERRPDGVISVERDGDDVFIGVSFFDAGALEGKEEVLLKKEDLELDKAKQMLAESEDE